MLRTNAVGLLPGNDSQTVGQRFLKQVLWTRHDVRVNNQSSYRFRVKGFKVIDGGEVLRTRVHQDRQVFTGRIVWGHVFATEVHRQFFRGQQVVFNPRALGQHVELELQIQQG